MCIVLISLYFQKRATTVAITKFATECLFYLSDPILCGTFVLAAFSIKSLNPCVHYFRFQLNRKFLCIQSNAPNKNKKYTFKHSLRAHYNSKIENFCVSCVSYKKSNYNNLKSIFLLTWKC